MCVEKDYVNIRVKHQCIYGRKVITENVSVCFSAEHVYMFSIYSFVVVGAAFVGH